MTRSRLLICLLALVGCAPSARQRAALDAWFACIECDRGELDSVVTVGGVRIVRALGRGLAGPSPVQLEAMRVQYLEEYRRLAGATAGALAETQDAFVGRLLSNLVAEHEKRAARALGRMDSWLARRALRNALRWADRYRPDVLVEIRTAGVTSVRAVAGDAQTDSVAQPVPVAPTVLVSDGVGPTPGVMVDFVVALGGGGVAGARQVTDSVGQASVGSWVLGPAPGPNTLVAHVGDDSATFTATALPARALVVVAGLAQSGRAGDTVGVRPVVQVIDAQGQPESGVVVQFLVVGGGGAVSDSIVPTGAAGRASPGSWTLGAPGLNVLAARVIGLPEVRVRAWALPP